jgi:hypothetical protein
MPRIVSRARSGAIRGLVVAAVVAIVPAGCGPSTNPDRRSIPATPPRAPVASTSSVPHPSPIPSPTATAAAGGTITGPGSWIRVASMNHPRSYGATATVLQDGRVLVAGGEGADGDTVASAELFDPASGRWTTTRSMLAIRRGHTATLLSDGRVLVAGGWSLHDPEGPPRFAELSIRRAVPGAKPGR